MDDPLGSIMDDDDDDVELEYTLSEEDFDLPSGEEDFDAEPESNAVLYPQASVASAPASEASQATVVPAYAPPRPCLDVNARVGAAKRAFCGAFARTDVMTEGIVNAWQELKPTLPVFFTIHGTNEDEAIALVRDRLNMEPYDLMDDAVKAAVAAAKETS